MKRNFYLKHPLMAMHDPRISVENGKAQGNRGLLVRYREIGYVARLMCRYGVFASLLQDA